jgi:hypothetical protein
MGLDLTNLQSWKDGATVVMSAPHIVVPLIFAACWLGWWWRGTTEKGEKSELKANLQTLESRIKLKDEQLATKEQQLKALEVQPAISSKEPAWKLFMTSANICTLDAPHQGKTGIFLDSNVLNTGSPSSVAEWDLSVIPQKRTPVILRPRAIAGRVRLAGDSAVINGEDSLIEKVKNKEIGKQRVEGWQFFITDLPHAAVIDSKTRLELSMSDIYGNKAKVSRLIDEF